jgi:hypothetical protein
MSFQRGLNPMITLAGQVLFQVLQENIKEGSVEA